MFKTNERINASKVLESFLLGQSTELYIFSPSQRPAHAHTEKERETERETETVHIHTHIHTDKKRQTEREATFITNKLSNFQ